MKEGHTGEPLVSVLMATFGAWEWVSRSLTAIEQHTDVAHETIVVDNASPDGTADLIAEHFPTVRLVRNSHNAGFGAANNQAAALAQGRYLALVNSDAIAPPGWFGPLRAALDEDGAGAAVPALLHPDGTMQNAGAVIAADGSVIALGDGDDPDAPQWNFRRAIDFGAAAFLLIERRLFLESGGFDEVFETAYFEDVDLGLRLLERGLRTVYVPGPRVEHGCFKSGGFDRAASLFRLNQPAFVERWQAALGVRHPASVWPPDPVTTLAARDATADARVLILADDFAVPRDDEAAIREAITEAPWARFTIAASSGDPGPWLRAGVEALPVPSPDALALERAGHYDVVLRAGTGELDGLPATVAELRSRAPRFGRNLP